MNPSQLMQSFRLFIWFLVLALPIAYLMGMRNVPLLNLLWLAGFGAVLWDIFKFYAKKVGL